MDDNLTAIIIVLICVLGPIWLTFQFINRARTTRQLNASDTAMLEQISSIAQRMESRMSAVERILDADSAGWRNNATETGGRYGQS